MTDYHRHPLLAWRPPGELADWARTEAGGNRGALSALLTEALTDLRAKRERKARRDRIAKSRQQEEQP